jgi:hypothetical protein
METIPPEALLEAVPPACATTAQALRDLVAAVWPDARERVRPGWGVIGYDVPVGRRSVYTAWIWAQREHVHLGFVHGDALEDPDGALGGSRGVRARWLTLQPGAQPDRAIVARLLEEAARVAAMSRGERAVRAVREAPPA